MNLVELLQLNLLNAFCDKKIDGKECNTAKALTYFNQDSVTRCKEIEKYYNKKDRDN